MAGVVRVTNADDPVAEAARWLDARLRDQPIPPILLVVGLGEGHLLDVLEQRAPATRVLALEPNPSVAEMFRARRDWSDWSDRLAYLVGPDYAGADQAWRIFPIKEHAHATLVHPELERNLDESVTRALRVLKEIVYGARANAVARARFAPRYLANTLRNLPALLAGSDAGALQDAYRGVPAVVAGAGPSLDDNITELKSLQDRAVIIACDTALRPMLERGLSPQFVVGLDPAELNARHFQQLPRHDSTWLVGEPALHHGAIESFGQRAFWFRVARHAPWPWYQELGIDVQQIDVWGSVLTGAFQTAVLLGCDPIVFIGADLSFTRDRPYARGTTFEFEWAQVVAAGTPLPDLWRSRISGGADDVELPDLCGVPTRTTRTLLSFRDWLVRRAEGCGRRVVNASGAGMLIGGPVAQSRLSEVLTTPVALPRVEMIPPISPLRGRHADLVASLKATYDDVVGGAATGSVASEWSEFCGEGYDAGAVRESIAATLVELDSPSSHDVHVFAPQAGLVGLPEREAVVRAAFTGTGIPEWVRSQALHGVHAGNAWRSAVADARTALEEALQLEGDPLNPHADIFGEDIERENGLAVLGRRHGWSDGWRLTLWNYHDALAIAVANGASLADAAGMLSTIVGDLDAGLANETRACDVDDLRGAYRLAGEGVHGYNLVLTQTGCMAIAQRLGDVALPEVPGTTARRWAQFGLLLWAPSESEIVARIQRYRRHIVRIGLVHGWATVTGAIDRDRFRRLISKAAGISADESAPASR